MAKIKNIGIIGGGAWGTALAAASARAGCNVMICAREDDVINGINKFHENKMFLEGIKLPDSVKATDSFDDLAHMDAVFMVTPAQFVRPTANVMKDYISAKVPIVLCSKGIEQSTGMLMTEVMAEIMPKNPLAVLSGPTFASEVAKNYPSAVTIASKYQKFSQDIADAIGQPNFRPYLSRDIAGAEVGGAVKNVLAIACGIVEGRGLGKNAHAALITRGLAEMMRFGHTRGADKETMMGLCGLGDLMLTCSSTQSRNMALGFALGQGEKLEDLMKDRKTVAEGYHTTSILARIIEEEEIDMPIVKAVNDILYKGKNVKDAIESLLSRPFRDEI